MTRPGYDHLAAQAIAEHLRSLADLSASVREAFDIKEPDAADMVARETLLRECATNLEMDGTGQG